MAEESSCSKLKKLARSSFKTVFPPINKQSLLYHYVPLSGAICHTAYHVHVVSPNFILKKFPVWNLAISNSLLFNAKLGIGSFLYGQKHMRKFDKWLRVEFSVFGSIMFNFGSLTLFLLLNAMFFEKLPNFWRSVVAAISSISALTFGYRYVKSINEKVL